MRALHITHQLTSGNTLKKSLHHFKLRYDPLPSAVDSSRKQVEEWKWERKALGVVRHKVQRPSRAGDTGLAGWG